MKTRVAVVVVVGLGILACADPAPAPAPVERGPSAAPASGGRGDKAAAGDCQPTQVECRGAELWRCTPRGAWKLDQDCGASGQYCMVTGADDEGPGPHFSGQCSKIAAACPFVDLETDAGWVTAGEILRNLNRPALYGSQSLELPASAVRDGRLTLRLAERKDEVTWLDAVWVEVGGRRIAPDGCAGDDCAIDRSFVQLRRGDVRTYSFELPDGAAPVLWAHGYYVPDPR